MRTLIQTIVLLLSFFVSNGQFLSPLSTLQLENHPHKDRYFIAKFYDKETGTRQEQWTMFSTVPEINAQNYNTLLRQKKIAPNGNRLTFYSTGEILSIWPYNNGIREGKLKAYYKTGELMYEAFSKRYLEGKLKHYYKNGALKKVEIFNEGVLSGTTKEFDETGKLKVKKQYRDGVLHGNYVSFHQTGKHKRIRNYIEGKLDDEECFDENGNKTDCKQVIISPTPLGGAKALEAALKQIDFIRSKNNTDSAIFRIILKLDTLGNTSFSHYYYKSDHSYLSQLKNWQSSLPQFSPFIYDGVAKECNISIALAVYQNKIIWPNKVHRFHRTSRNQTFQQNQTSFFWDYSSAIPNSSVLFVADKMPQFPGGEKKLQEFISSKLAYPTQAQKENGSGKITIALIVNKEGVLKSFRILRNENDLLAEEALRLAKLMPKWIPGEHNGQVRAVQVVCNFDFISKNKVRVTCANKPRAKY